MESARSRRSLIPHPPVFAGAYRMDRNVACHHSGHSSRAFGAWTLQRATGPSVDRLLKNIHPLRSAPASSLRGTYAYASFLAISQALHLSIFNRPANHGFLNTRLGDVHDGNSKKQNAPAENAPARWVCKDGPRNASSRRRWAWLYALQERSALLKRTSMALAGQAETQSSQALHFSRSKITSISGRLT